MYFTNDYELGAISGSLQEHKEVIKELMNTYIINLNEDGEPKASITDN